MTGTRSGGLIRSIRSGIAPAAKSLLFRTGALCAVRALRPSDRLAILRYHAICGPEGYSYAGPDICISPGAFETHVAYLASNYAVLSLPEAVERLRGGVKLPANAVAITFDDGYADNLAAARTLAKHGVSATFYLTAGCLADGQPFWPAELRVLVRAIRQPQVHLSVAPVELELNLKTDADCALAIARLTKTFKAHPIPVREELRGRLRQLAGPVATPRVMLNWEEIREMQALGMTIGSHTMTHPNLPNAGLDAAREELVASRCRLEHEIGAAVTMFSYPNGGAERYLTREVQGAVREAGYAAATTSRNAFAGAGSDLFALERIEVEESLQELVFALEVERFVLRPQPRPGEAE